MEKIARYPGFIAKILLAGVLLFSAACSEQEVVEPTSTVASQGLSNKMKEKTFYGPATPMGKGVARAWVSVNDEGEPTAVGVNISAKVVDNLGMEPKVFTLRLPKQAEATLYEFVSLDWNPGGHPPFGIYNVDHFDLHFYMIPEEEVMAIPGMDPGMPGSFNFDTPVPAQFVPWRYVMDPGIVPAMGVHWGDWNEPQYNGQPFTRTMILGSYQGEFIFHEPMFTLDYLHTKPNIEIPIPQASAYQKPGYYPLSYSFMYSDTPKEYTIALTDLTWKE
ncbi:DUF5602 domain-containing protein [Rufibacter radiotolerans]|uniref:DUF5602 domain-containing protein n=1 Tax=Rufibacter radiotolerans TaxID=1379910 RepID=UPI0006647F41|nr:DUF5602 domain-containing protein [Rufibacter radiotolerans]